MTTTNTTTKTTTRFWVVCGGSYATYTTSCKTEADALAKANMLTGANVDVLRIERQTTTTTTSIICEY